MGSVRGRSTRWLAVTAALVVGAAACSGSDDAADPTDTGPAGDEVAEPAAEPADESDESAQSVDDETDETDEPRVPLGFEEGVIEVPIPPPEGELPGRFDDGNALVAAGVEAGVWTEAEGTRALMAVLMGELPPDRIPALEALPKPHYSEVIERAIELAADPNVDEAQRADLARLVRRKPS